MKILITGHRGFVGRHFVRALQGHDITGVDIVSAPWNGVTTDLQEDCRRFFARCDTRFDMVIHLAAVVGGRATIEGQPLKVATDLAIDSDLWQWALRTRPGRIVYYSSSAAYPVRLQQRCTVCDDERWIEDQNWSPQYPELWKGERYPGDGLVRCMACTEYEPLSEDDIDLTRIANPDMTYGWSKLTGEMLAQHAESEGFRVHVFRPFSGYGEDQDSSYPFGAFRDRARARADPFEVWGTGEQVRDFIHISDVVGATLAAVEQDVPGPVNLCTGRPTSFLELADLFTKEAGYRPEIRPLADKPVGVQYRVGDPSRMLLFYQPRVSLEEGIRRALG